ncbi:MULTISPECIES: division/cell wall cluster transcriptional repressor MraZ [Roseinatronobacter]|uniref:Transcriptional regulator MraZ n=1 Tax=Roseinatronobacter domitianus TaxID=2940293 RepID=A0ABT0M1Z7_9RHOB|nr:cell division/cell wall cluster transcriptional repressor MraZ [Roseibaca sp.]MCL1628884.1 cell division/cell wall cluster transcriptional repressor MraZ [Roseibaca domitiana]
MARKFRGSFHQKVDGKGRVSIPASFRRVVESGDPDWTDGLRPNLVIVYGLDSQKRLDCYTLNAIEDIEDRIDLMQPGSPERETLELTFHGHAADVQIDEDGRIVLPQRLRDKLELEPNEAAFFIAKGDHFQIWKEDTFKVVKSSRTDVFLADQAPDFDARIHLPPRPASAVGTEADLLRDTLSRRR